MSASAYRRCRREQLAWRVRQLITDPGTYRYIGAVLGTSAIIVSLWAGVA